MNNFNFQSKIQLDQPVKEDYQFRPLSVLYVCPSIFHAPYNVDDARLELRDGLERPLAEVDTRPRPLEQESQGSHCRDLQDEGEKRLLTRAAMGMGFEEERRITYYRD